MCGCLEYEGRVVPTARAEVEAQLRFVAGGLGVSYERLVADLEKARYVRVGVDGLRVEYQAEQGGGQ